MLPELASDVKAPRLLRRQGEAGRSRGHAGMGRGRSGRPSSLTAPPIRRPLGSGAPPPAPIGVSVGFGATSAQDRLASSR